MIGSFSKVIFEVCRIHLQERIQIVETGTLLVRKMPANKSDDDLLLW